MVFKRETTDRLNLTASLKKALESDDVFHLIIAEISLLANNRKGSYKLEQVLFNHEGQLKEVVFDGKHYS